MTGARAWVAALVLLVACTPAEQHAVDGCLLQEYLQECETELATPEEAADCQRRAPLEASRVLAAIPAQCRQGG